MNIISAIIKGALALFMVYITDRYIIPYSMYYGILPDLQLNNIYYLIFIPFVLMAVVVKLPLLMRIIIFIWNFRRILSMLFAGKRKKPKEIIEKPAIATLHKRRYRGKKRNYEFYLDRLDESTRERLLQSHINTDRQNILD